MYPNAHLKLTINVIAVVIAALLIIFPPAKQGGCQDCTIEWKPINELRHTTNEHLAHLNEHIYLPYLVGELLLLLTATVTAHFLVHAETRRRAAGTDAGTSSIVQNTKSIYLTTLPKAFWWIGLPIYVVSTLLVNSGRLSGALKLSVGLATPVVILAYVCPLIWISANHYRGPIYWKYAAKLAAIVSAIFYVNVLYVYFPAAIHLAMQNESKGLPAPVAAPALSLNQERIDKGDGIAARASLPQDAETAFWNEVKQNGTREYLDAYLTQYPNGRYEALARMMLAEVKKTETELRPGKVFKDCPECPEMVVMPVGSFQMGSNKTASELPVHTSTPPLQWTLPPSNETASEMPVHTVYITKPFALGKTEVTQGQWRAIMGSNPSHFSACGDRCPVEQVNWEEAQEFVRKLSQKTGKQYRLPSEAEWVYACKAGSNHNYCGSDSLDSVAWYDANSGMKTHPVGQRQANAWGLHDMSGNVGEWMGDCWNGTYNGAPTDGSAWTSGECASRVVRGGSMRSAPWLASSAYRDGYDMMDRNKNRGFRVVRTLL